MSCKFCGNQKTEVTEVQFKDGSTHLKEFCNTCERWLGWVPKNADPSQFVMPFGKHKGETIKEIAAHDFEYIVWASENLEGTVQRRLKNYIAKHRFDDPPGAA